MSQTEGLLISVTPVLDNSTLGMGQREQRKIIVKVNKLV